MAKAKAKKPAAAKPQNVQPQTVISETEDVLFDLSDPDEFRRAFIASEILNRKY